MELILSPHDSENLQLVLRTRQHLVEYNSASHALILRSTQLPAPVMTNSVARAMSQEASLHSPAHSHVCPVCQRPWEKDFFPSSSMHTSSSWTNNENDLVHVAPHYFRLLSQVPLLGTTNSNVGSPPVCEEVNEGYYERFFVEIRQLGRGSRGTVYLCQHVLNGHELGMYAVKKVPVGNHDDTLSQSLGEVHLMEELIHPNVIHYKHAWVEMSQASPFTPRVPTLHVLMMAANGGSLADWISARSGDSKENSKSPKVNQTYVDRLKTEFRKRRHAKECGEPRGSTRTGIHFLREEEIVQLMIDITRGLDFLHNRGVLHLDLKPGNVLLHWDDDALLPKALLSDFGSSLPVHENWLRKRTGHTGTLEYMAPETIVPHRGQLAELSSKADIWSLGILLYVLIFFELPYTQVDDVDLLQSEISAFHSLEDTIHCRRQSRRYSHVHPALGSLLNNMLQVYPPARPTCRDILTVLEHYPDAPTSALQVKQSSAVTILPALKISTYTRPSFAVKTSLHTPALVLLVISIIYMQILLADHLGWIYGSQYHVWIRHVCTLLALAQLAWSVTSRPSMIGSIDRRWVFPSMILVILIMAYICTEI